MLPTKRISQEPTKTIVISIDAMGGANAPASVINGLELVLEARVGHLLPVEFLIFGQEQALTGLIEQTRLLKHVCKVVNCSSVISDDEQPVKAMRTGAESSMRGALNAVRDEIAVACVSGGNTGALMVMAKFVLGMLPGIKRPAIVSIFPNRKRGSVMLDLGANAECDPIHLEQFATMGCCFAHVVLGCQNPTVGILNVGVEEYKGRELDRKASTLLKSSGLNYYGFIEGHDLSEGTVDVVVTDGFVGNVALKVAEGVAKTCAAYMKLGFSSSLLAKLGALLAARGLRKSFSMIDPRRYNGAMFIGLDGIVVKSHGSSDEEGFANAVNVSISLVERGINAEIVRMIATLHEHEESGSIMSKIRSKLGL